MLTSGKGTLSVPMPVLAAALMFSACASRQPSLQLEQELGRADALVADGCSRCLSEALSIYERAAGMPNAPADASRGAFRTAVLLVARARELGLPSDLPIARAREWAGRLAAPATPTAAAKDASPTLLLDALPLVVGETYGLPPEERERVNRERRDVWPADGSLPAARAALSPWAHADVVAQYLVVAIDCQDARARKGVNHTEVAARYPQPLIRWRLALCGIPGLRLDPLRAADARWTDTLFFEGRAEMTKFPAPDVGRAADLFTEAHAAFPDSVAITLSLGNARNALEEHLAALELFDSILTTQPTHRDAMLGRLLSLSYLKRHYDAVRVATRMLDLGTYHIGDAYYWRAWNRYQVHELPAAWSDVEASRKLMVNTAVYTLAGFIAYALRELDTAIDRLSEAYRLDNTNCEAAWTEGMVQVDKQTWEGAAARFTTAAGCFATDAEAARAAIVTAQNSTWSEALKARRIATAQKRAETSEHRQAQSAYNAASGYLRLGRKPEALGYIDMAAHHPLLKEKAEVLRAAIQKLP